MGRINAPNLWLLPIHTLALLGEKSPKRCCSSTNSIQICPFLKKWSCQSSINVCLIFINSHRIPVKTMQYSALRPQTTHKPRLPTSSTNPDVWSILASRMLEQILPRNKLLNLLIWAVFLRDGSHKCSKPLIIAHTYPGTIGREISQKMLLFNKFYTNMPIP